MSLINAETTRANPRLDGLDRAGLKDLIKQAREALNPRYKISDDYSVAGNVMLFAEHHSSGKDGDVSEECQAMIDEYGESWFYDQLGTKAFSGSEASDGEKLEDVLKQFKCIKKYVDAFIKAAEEAKRHGADTIVRCDADEFDYNSLEGYEDDE